jgi:hypothetical protein
VNRACHVLHKLTIGVEVRILVRFLPVRKFTFCGSRFTHTPLTAHRFASVLYNSLPSYPHHIANRSTSFLHPSIFDLSALFSSRFFYRTSFAFLFSLSVYWPGLLLVGYICYWPVNAFLPHRILHILIHVYFSVDFNNQLFKNKLSFSFMCSNFWKLTINQLNFSVYSNTIPYHRLDPTPDLTTQRPKH